MRRTFAWGAMALPVLVSLLSLAAGTAPAEEAKKIRDNSFLIEEAYNQEPGVIQHILALQTMKGGAWDFTFTEEWPVPRETHQLSLTVPAARLDEDGSPTGLGDILLNYRYQAVLEDPVALAPRLSLVLPTGDAARGLGGGSLGLQASIPLSVELAERWVTHWNLGATYIPDAVGPAGARGDTTAFNYGASVIYLASENFNVLVEAVGTAEQSLQPGGGREWEESFFLNPGVRFAVNYESGLQIVPGIAFPVGVGPSSGEYGVFLYLSFEHPAF